ncbi:Pentatricopeptide repeat-containing protein [Vitis vinifera]|uniref:Pentatricopeptide repeat-containing protein n=1 Tax=Vitis vinifera TaxID=29760 RepID=A0A438F1T1_VITVI|nr:Pentatricopeptide repeat-containing protein [Vitis vinifera]
MADLCNQHGEVEYADLLFKRGTDPNAFSYNAMIRAYKHNKVYVLAITVYKQMGVEEMTERDAVSWNTLISEHVRLGQMRRARAIFEELQDKTIFSWIAIVSGYARIGCHAVWNFSGECKWWVLSLMRSVLFLFYQLVPGWELLNEGCRLFDQMNERDVISWSTMIVALANHGRAREAIELFQEMQKAKGLKYFESMKRDDYIEPGAEHYGCLVNLLGLSGSHGNLEIAAIAIEHLLELEPVDMGNCLAFESLCRLGKVGWCIENEETYE